jgi:hypothetical protein
VAGVKIEIDDEKSVGGAKVRAGFDLSCMAVERISREKARKPQNQRNVCVAHGRNYSVVRGFSRCRFAGQRHGPGNDGQRNGAPFSAAINGIGREKTRMARQQRNVLGRLEAVL